MKKVRKFYHDDLSDVFKESKNTHRWRVFENRLKNEDLSTLIEKVIFVLHETIYSLKR